MSIPYFAVSLHDMKLSIVIPVYRVENTLDRCVESVLNQKYDNMEVVLVDDGSPDRCPQMCDEWAKHDQRISVIHKENGGLSDARNAGIEQATGDYITFVDSDDYLETGTYPALMQLLATHPEYDILEYPCTTYPLTDHTYTDMNDYWLEGEAYRHTYAWNKIYRRQLFKDVRFPVGKVFEDVYTLPQLLTLCKTVATTSQGLYHYMPNTQGITRTAGGKELQMLLEAHVDVLRKGFPKTDDEYYMHVVNIQMDVFERLGTRPIIPPFHVTIGHISDIKLKTKAISLKILGINTLCLFNKLMHKILGRHL